MKIGILTHQYINNYGAFLQAYALREAVSKLFLDAEVQIINYVNVRHFVINAGGWFRFYRDREDILCWLQKICLLKTFAKARKQDMQLSKRCYTAKEINALKFDCIIVGSDEVWNFEDAKGNDPIKFGEGLDCKNLIAYAPSVGQAVVTGNLPEYIVSGIKRFTAISARDDLTFELAKRVTGTNPIPVLDPTFLTQFPRIDFKVKQKPYILFYYCERLPKHILDQIYEYAHDHKLGVYGAGECDRRYTEITVNLKPFEWVEMFKSAEFVFTGTFHGCVFSILNRKQFKVHLTNRSRTEKVGALLKELQIDGRNIENDFVFDLEKMCEEIDYGQVYQIIDKKREQSLEFLRKSIEGVK